MGDKAHRLYLLPLYRWGRNAHRGTGAFSEGEIKVFPEYEAGLKNVDGFSHLILLYYFHEVKGYPLSVKPFLENTPRGLFATRYPAGSNPSGLSVVRLLARRENILQIAEVDLLDRTPLLDINLTSPSKRRLATRKSPWRRRTRGSQG